MYLLMILSKNYFYHFNYVSLLIRSEYSHLLYPVLALKPKMMLQLMEITAAYLLNRIRYKILFQFFPR